MNNVFISIGSNLGDRISYCKDAIDEIGSFAKIVKTSSMYETDPVGKEDQPEFVNCAVQIETDFSPHELLRALNIVEEKLGRERHEKWGPRTIDLDIIFYGNTIIDDEDLVIPHPRAHMRRFVLEPICEIDPNFIHPTFNSTITELLKRIDDNKRVIKIS